LKDNREGLTTPDAAKAIEVDEIEARVAAQEQAAGDGTSWR
jgi:hypothetical protein